MKSFHDIELDIKNALAANPASGEITISVGVAKKLVERLKEYRQRINKNASKFHKRMGKLQSELYDLKTLHTWARKRLDPEGRGTDYSQFDKAIVAEHIKSIEEMRGKIIAQRMIWGRGPEPLIQQETIGALRAAISHARGEETKWRDYLKDSRQKLTPLEALTRGVWQEHCDCCGKKDQPEKKGFLRRIFRF